jgi:multicomponent Na+:H+ antiporter subunit D
MNSLHIQSIILIVVVPLMSSYAIPLIGWKWRKTAFFVAQGAVTVSMMCSFVILQAVMTRGTIHYHMGGWLPPWGIEYVVDPLNAFMLVMVCVLSFFITLASRASVERELPDRKVRFYTIYLLLFTGLLGIVVTGDAFNLYVFLEIASLTAYALIAIGEDGAPLASFNYIIMGTIGACFYLLGVGYLYIITGSLNMADLAKLLPPLYESKVTLVALVFFVMGMGIKMGLFPMHFWLPDAYTFAPSAVSSFIAPLMTKVMAYVLFRVLLTVFEPSYSLQRVPVGLILSWLAAAAILIGSILAIAQSDLKRMLAYSSVANIGYIVLGLGMGNKLALIGGLFHILNHAFMKAALFMASAGIMYKRGGRIIYQFRGLRRKMPLTMGAFTVATLSMVGIPPTAGFFSKLYLILGAIEARQWVFIAVILISSLLNAVYFFRVIEMAFFKPWTSGHAASSTPAGDGEKSGMDEMPWSMLIPTLAVAAGIVLLGIFNGPIISGVLERVVPRGF